MNYHNASANPSQSNNIAVKHTINRFIAKHLPIEEKKFTDSMRNELDFQAFSKKHAVEIKQARKVVYGDLYQDGDSNVAIFYTFAGFAGYNVEQSYLAVFLNHRASLSTKVIQRSRVESI